jgi:hypothetical protein
MVKRQLVKLVANITVKVSPKRAVQPAPDKTIVVNNRVVGRTGVLRGLGVTARHQLLI